MTDDPLTVWADGATADDVMAALERARLDHLDRWATPLRELYIPPAAADSLGRDLLARWAARHGIKYWVQNPPEPTAKRRRLLRRGNS